MLGRDAFIWIFNALKLSSTRAVGFEIHELAAEEDDIIPVKEDTVGVDSALNNSTLDVDGTAPVPQDMLRDREVAINNNDATLNHSMELLAEEDTSMYTSSETDDYTEQGVSDNSSWSSVIQDLLHSFQNSMDRILASMQDCHKNVGKIVDIMEKNADHIDDEHCTLPLR
jgi:hypothetical protein